MPRPVTLLAAFTVLGIAAGAYLHFRQPQSQSQPQRAALNATKAPSASTGSTLPPAVSSASNVSPTISLISGASDDASANGSEPDVMEKQIRYLQQQVEALRQENSQLIDQLASAQNAITPGQPATGACGPASPGTGASWDFAGIGIELLKIRGVRDIPIPAEEVDRSEVQKRISTWLQGRYAAGYGLNLGRALAALGAIPAPVDTLALKAEFLSYQIGGWYDSTTQTLYLSKGADGISPEKENALALSYGYLFKQRGEALFPKGETATTLDAHLARECLLGGDATLTRFYHAMNNPTKGGGGGVGEDPDDPSRAVPIPSFLRSLELIPFMGGFDFMQTMHSIGKWDQVNAVYRRPPVSMAEIQDTDVYLQETAFTPKAIPGSDFAINGAQPVHQDTLGPAAVFLFLQQHVAGPVAAEVPPGWANDRLLAYPAAAGSTRDNAVWRTAWKDSNAADAFFSAMRTSLLSRYRDAKTGESAPPDTFRLDPPGRFILMKRNSDGTGVTFIDAADSAFATAALQKFGSL